MLGMLAQPFSERKMRSTPKQTDQNTAFATLTTEAGLTEEFAAPAINAFLSYFTGAKWNGGDILQLLKRPVLRKQ
jgi:hypothetical protein